MVAANNSILDNYHVMPILNSAASIRKILLKILLLFISVVLMEDQSRFVTSYMGP